MVGQRTVGMRNHLNIVHAQQISHVSKVMKKQLTLVGVRRGRESLSSNAARCRSPPCNNLSCVHG